MATVTLQSICRIAPTPPPSAISEESSCSEDGPNQCSTPAKTTSSQPVAIPTRHLANPLSPLPNAQALTPPDTPPSDTVDRVMSSKLYPPDDYELICDSPPVRSIDAAGVAAAMAHHSTQPIPHPDTIFPWAHGSHPDNHLQNEFFATRKKAPRQIPAGVRFITVVKVGGDLGRAKLKGAVAPDEILVPGCGDDEPAAFVSLDPPTGFCVRNFQIQVSKFAALSDVVVYGGGDDCRTGADEVLAVARRISLAQQAFRAQADVELPVYSTFVVRDSFETFEKNHPELVSIDSKGKITGNVVEFYYWERMEMCAMSRATEISRNVWLGSTADAGLDAHHSFDDGHQWDIMVEASDLARVPSGSQLRHVAEALEQTGEMQHLEFPSSGSVFPTPYETDGIIDTCRWIYSLANENAWSTPASAGAPTDGDGDTAMRDGNSSDTDSGRGAGGRKVLIHCTDGYTESSLLALAYVVFAEALPVHDAWLYLHKHKQRNFFAYNADLNLLRHMQSRLLRASPRGFHAHHPLVSAAAALEPKWLGRMDGSLPSRILPYMYLGNLLHANNPGLLFALGIRRVLSIGELTSWAPDDVEAWGARRIMSIENIQDNGLDPVTELFRQCLDFIDEGRRLGEPTLVHCRVGVSRSATICIAEVMRSQGLSVPKAYCYVRARRLNVIIQPHCKFMYELLKWEELQTRHRKSNVSVKREMEWPTIAREIAAMNRPYSSR